MRRMSALVTVLAATISIGCESTKIAAPSITENTATFDKAKQAAMTPDTALARLTDGNKRFVAGNSTRWDYVSQMKSTSAGQYPVAVVISCLDSRATPEIIFDQGLGDIFVGRVAGNYAPTDLIGSAEFGTKVSGAKLILVLGHTECGAIKGACDNVELGNLTTVIKAIEPATADAKDVAGEHNSKNKKYVQAVAEANVRRSVAELRSKSTILKGLEDAGEIKIVGAMYDISTGEVTVLK